MTNHFTTEEVEIGILVVEVAADVSSAVRVRGCGSSLKRSSAAAESVSEMLPLALLLLPVVLAGNLDEVFRWKQLDFEFPSDSARAEALASRRFIPANNIPVGVEAWNDRIFVTVPRWKAGVPASLGFLYRNDTSDGPRLRPYPSWQWHELSRTSGQNVIVSPFRVRADGCGRLWVLDTGVSDIMGGAAMRVVHPTRMLVFDLNTDKLIRTIVFPQSVLKEDSFFANIAVEVAPGYNTRLDCFSTFAYAADLGAYGLVVYDWARNATWRVSHNYFHSDPLAGEYSVQGIDFQWTDGLFGLALSAPDKAGHRNLYFHPFSSTNEFVVPTRVLHEKQIEKPFYHDFKLLGSRGPKTQSCASFMDEKSGVLFYTQVNLNSIGCWNSELYSDKYLPSTQGHVNTNNITMVFPNDIKVDENRTLWVLTDRMPVFLYSELDPVDVNFRILSAPVDKAIEGTVCSPNTPIPAPDSGATTSTLSITSVIVVACLLAEIVLRY